MALTRRFFTRLAAEFKDARPPLSNVDGTPLAVWAHMVTITANNLAVQNAMFNHQRFYEACGMPEEYIERAAG